jgi:glutamate dehydrogenase/leucine dehydrogenase
MTEVLIDGVKDVRPGTVISYTDLIHLLNCGSSKQHTIADVRGAISRTKSRLLRDYSRAMRCVVGKGYKIAAATEHREIALLHKAKSNRQISKGLLTLQHVNWGEMEPEARKAHEGTLMVISALHEQQTWMDRRLKKVEDAISKFNGNREESTT